MSRKKIAYSILGSSLAVTAIALPVAYSAFDLADLGILEKGSVSDIQPGSTADNLRTVSFKEGKSSASDTDNAAALPSSMSFVTGTTFSPDMIRSEPTKEGYGFRGYYADDSCSVPFQFYDEVDSDLTIYVRFLPLSKYTYKTASGEERTLDKTFSIAEDTELKEDASSKQKQNIFTWDQSTDSDVTLNLTDSVLDGNKTYSLQVNAKNNNLGDTISIANGYKDSGDAANGLINSSSRFFTLKMTSDLTIKKGTTLEIGGTSQLKSNIFYGAFIGNNFSLDLNGHKLIVEDGATLNIYGLITDSTRMGRVECLAGSNVKAKMVVYGSGGSFASGFTGAKATPFASYGFPNIDASLRIHAGTSFKGIVSYGTSSMAAVSEFSFVDDSTRNSGVAPLLDLSAKDTSKESYLDLSHNMIPVAHDGKNTNMIWDSEYEEYFNFYNCKVVLGSLSANISFLNIDTAEYLWDLPGQANVKMFNSSLTIKNQFQLMPGFQFYSDADTDISFGVAGADKAGESYTTGIGISRSYYSYFSNNGSIFNNATVDAGYLNYRSKRQPTQVVIRGDISFNRSADNTFFGGFVQLSDKALQSTLKAAKDKKVTLLYKGGQSYGYYKSFGADFGYAEYFTYPLIVGNRVYTADNMSGDIHFLNDDPSLGIYTDGKDNYAYFLNSGERLDTMGGGEFSLKKITLDTSNYTYTAEDGKKYLQYCGISMPISLEKDGQFTLENKMIGSSDDYDNIIVKPGDRAGTFVYVSGSHSGSGGGGGGCISADTMITMADGTQRRADRIKIGDLILTHSFETGKDIPGRVFYYEMVEMDAFAVDIKMSNGAMLKIAVSQSFFSTDDMKFIAVNKDNYRSILGRHLVFRNPEDGKYLSAEVVAVEGRETRGVFGDIFVEHTLNFFADNFLNVFTPYGDCTYFSVDRNLRYDQAEMEDAIKNIGFAKPEDMKDYFGEKLFDLFDGKYFNIGIRKGIFTFDEIVSAIDYVNKIKKYFDPSALK